MAATATVTEAPAAEEEPHVRRPTPEPLVDRPSGERAEPGAEESGPPRLLVFFGVSAVFALAYALVGYQITVEQHVIPFDALDRLQRAFLVWHNDPPKLASIGFFFPPLTSLVFLPLAAIKGLATSLVALPVTSAVFAGITIAFLDRTLARCEMGAIFRYPLLLIFALHPLFVFYAGNGMSEAVYLAFLAAGLYCLVGMFSTGRPRFLIGAGIAFSMLVLLRYSFSIWALAVMLVIGVALARRGRGGEEGEGSVIAFAAPIAYVLALWSFFNQIITGDAFGWLKGSTSTTAVNATGANGGVDFGEVLELLLDLTVTVAPIVILAVVALLFSGFSRSGGGLAFLFVALIALGVVIMGADALIDDEASRLAMRNFLPVLLTGFIGAAWAYRSLEAARLPMFVAMVVLGIISVPLAFNTMKDYPHQNLEEAFTRAVETGEDQEGTESRGGFEVSIDSERAMAAYINENVDGENAILADNAMTFGVILLSGRPEIFLDRIDRGDDVFREVAASPFGEVDFVLLSSGSAGDVIRAEQPGLLEAPPPGFSVAFETERYSLFAVSENEPAAPGGEPGSDVTPSTGEGTEQPGVAGGEEPGAEAAPSAPEPQPPAGGEEGG